MKTSRITLTLLLAALPAITQADGRAVRLRADLIGFEEVPSVSTPAHGRFKARIAPDAQSIDYELSYSDLAGTIQMSHIHFGQKSVNGSIVVWLCQTATTQAPPAVQGITPTCPQAGTVTGTITAANVIAASTTSQLILANELDEVIDAIKGGVAYVNVHSQPLNGGGEIRGQIKRVD